jgi:hypothetical protein
MLGGLIKRRTLHRLGAAAALTFIVATGGQAEVQSRGDDSIHLGVASCAGNNCHGATERSQGSSVAQNEYLIGRKLTSTTAPIPCCSRSGGCGSRGTSG